MQAFSNGIELPLCKCSKYVVFGDAHRGMGTAGDNFLKNQYLFSAALEYYSMRHFSYIEPGDGEELWENRSLEKIQDCHSNVYRKFAQLERQKRFYRIYGNHDMQLRKLFPESICLKNGEGGKDMYIIHGHQADFFNSVCWRISRFLVRYVWKPLEQFGVNDPTSAARNYKKTKRYETCMAQTAEKTGNYLIAGHSHRSHLVEGELYVNAGSCVHPSGITVIEIENMEMSLVKWQIGAKKDGILFAERVVLVDHIPIS